MGPSAGAGMMIGVLGAWRLSWRLALIAADHSHSEQLLTDYDREQHVGSDDTQDANALIFRNMALSNDLLGRVRSLGLDILDRIPQVRERMVEREALISQKLPVTEAVDNVTVPNVRSLETSGRWHVGKRLPAHVGGKNLLETANTRHILFAVDSKDEELGQTIADELRSSASVPISDRIMTVPSEAASRNRDREAIYALVRPDQHIVSLFKESL
jgi:hypothetical protein